MEKVLKIVLDHSIKTGNGSGITFHQAWEDSKMNLQEFTDHVDLLISEKKIQVREGINHKLLFAL